MEGLDNSTSLKDSNPCWEYFRESKALCDYRRKARVRTLKQHQNISVLHAFYLSHFKLVLISSRVSLQLLWWQLTLSWEMSKARDSAPGTRHNLHSESGKWGRFFNSPQAECGSDGPPHVFLSWAEGQQIYQDWRFLAGHTRMVTGKHSSLKTTISCITSLMSRKSVLSLLILMTAKHCSTSFTAVIHSKQPSVKLSFQQQKSFKNY